MYLTWISSYQQDEGTAAQEKSRAKKTVLSLKQQLESLTSQRKEMAQKCGVVQENSAESKINQLQETITQLKDALAVLATME